jgi:hypothetical protein
MGKIVSLEHHLTPEEFVSIKEQSRCRVGVPQMHVNQEDSFLDCTFSAPMLYQMQDQFLKEKYGNDLHNLHGLFMKGDKIWSLGGSIIIVPSQNDLCIETIHCQTKLMGEYANIYGTDGFKMSDGTRKITKYDMTFFFWMVVDCWLRSKFVGYTANFTENSKVIIDGAEVFLKQEVASASPTQDNNHTIFVGGIPGYIDLFANNEINVDAYCIHSSSIDNNHKPDDFFSKKSQVSGFMTDEGSAFTMVAEHFDWTLLLGRRHFATQILTEWHGIPYRKQFQSDVYNILDSPLIDTMESLLKLALSKYCMEKAQVLLNKISEKKHQLCYKYTCKTFTAGQVSDQRME